MSLFLILFFKKVPYYYYVVVKKFKYNERKKFLQQFLDMLPLKCKEANIAFNVFYLMCKLYNLVTC